MQVGSRHRAQWLRMFPKRQKSLPSTKEVPHSSRRHFVSCYPISKSHQIKAPLGLFMLHISKFGHPCTLGPPGTWLTPAAHLCLTLNTKDDGRPLLYWDANTALLQIPRYAGATSLFLINHIYH